jgi:hypothetical protein
MKAFIYTVVDLKNKKSELNRPFLVSISFKIFWGFDVLYVERLWLK